MRQKTRCGRNRLSPASARLCLDLRRSLSTLYVEHRTSPWLYHIADTRLSVQNVETKSRTGLEGCPVSAVSRFRPARPAPSPVLLTSSVGSRAEIDCAKRQRSP